MTPSCTTALHLLLEGIGVNETHEVIAPECTWIGSTACIKYQRAKTVFADIDSQHWCLTKESIERVLSDKTKAVIAVDLYGNMPDWDALTDFCTNNNIVLIEDAAEALGSQYKGIKAGKFGTASVFSFHRTKTITTGEGGMLLLDDDELFERCKFLRDHGRDPGTYYNTEVTFKYMPFNLQAALGFSQFQRIDQLLEKKLSILHGYKDRLKSVEDIYLNHEPDHVINGAWASALVFGKSHNITSFDAIEKLQRLNVPSRPFFFPLSSLPAYPDDPDVSRLLNPVAYDVASRGIHLPCAYNLTEDDLDKISSSIIKILQ
jgi:perosamine synthetase